MAVSTGLALLIFRGRETRLLTLRQLEHQQQIPALVSSKAVVVVHDEDHEGGVAVSGIVITAAPPTRSTGTIGDSNNTHELEQGQFIIASNIISNSLTSGVSINAERDPDDMPHAGSVRNFPELINSRLVPGVVVSNNVIEVFGNNTGITYKGSIDTPNQPDSARPFGRILNNTIVNRWNSPALAFPLHSTRVHDVD